MHRRIPDLSDLIGSPFIEHGRSPVYGFDCYGLAMEVSKRFGHHLPDLFYAGHDGDTFNSNYGIILSMLGTSLEMTGEKEAGDIILFDERGMKVHIGVCLECDDFIHCDKNGVYVIQFSKYFRKNYEVYKWSV